jgi:hypothetical protein
MNYFERLDAFFMPEGYEVSFLEKAARCCCLRAIHAKTIWAAMLAQSCAMDIRSLPEWTVYQKKVM